VSRDYDNWTYKELYEDVKGSLIYPGVLDELIARVKEAAEERGYRCAINDPVYRALLADEVEQEFYRLQADDPFLDLCTHDELVTHLVKKIKESKL
jgi:hypothetical protein